MRGVHHQRAFAGIIECSEMNPDVMGVGVGMRNRVGDKWFNLLSDTQEHQRNYE